MSVNVSVSFGAIRLIQIASVHHQVLVCTVPLDSSTMSGKEADFPSTQIIVDDSDEENAQMAMMETQVTMVTVSSSLMTVMTG